MVQMHRLGITCRHCGESLQPPTRGRLAITCPHCGVVNRLNSETTNGDKKAPLHIEVPRRLDIRSDAELSITWRWFSLGAFLFVILAALLIIPLYTIPLSLLMLYLAVIFLFGKTTVRISEHEVDVTHRSLPQFWLKDVIVPRSEISQVYVSLDQQYRNMPNLNEVDKTLPGYEIYLATTSGQHIPLVRHIPSLEGAVYVEHIIELFLDAQDAEEPQQTTVSAPSEAPTELDETVCRFCGNPLPAPDDSPVVTCGQCSALNATADVQHVPPPGFRSEEIADALHVSFTWHQTYKPVFALLDSVRLLGENSVFGVSVVFAAVFAGAYFAVSHPVAARIVPVVFLLASGAILYYVFARNRTYITLTKNHLDTVNGPAIRYGAAPHVNAQRINRLYSFNADSGYDVRAILDNGTTACVQQLLGSAQQAIYLEQEIERFLGLEGTSTNDDVMPTKNPPRMKVRRL